MTVLENNKPMTTSLKVAEVLGKNHRDVLRDIRNLVEKGVRNFAQSSYINQQNKEQPMFLMTRDGFTFLAMGLTFLSFFPLLPAYQSYRSSPKVPEVGY